MENLKNKLCKLRRFQNHSKKLVKVMIKALLTILICVFIFSSCSLLEVVPIQMARVTQTEYYEQYFTFLEAPSTQLEEKKNQSQSDEQSEFRKIDQVFNKLLGDKNWQNIKNLYGVGQFRNELVEHQIFIQGIINFVIYVDPSEQDLFFIEGMGSYYIIRKKTQAILLSGDFYIPLRQKSLYELEKGELIVDVELYVTRVPQQITYLKQIGLKYKIYLNKDLIKHEIFSIDYSAEHEVYLTDRTSLPSNALIAYLKFPQNNRLVKLIDMRGRKFLTKDYREIILEGEKSK